jgi:cellulose synthase/poly-beta-1,6-N-acetylglucosamine synthase-like glycosyltransferase
MSGAEWIFWLSIAAVAYNYAGYPVLLFICATIAQAGRDLRFLLSRRDRRGRAADRLPNVAILIAAFNEQDVIEAKLRNTALLHYQTGQVEVLLGLDAPTDASAERAQSVTIPSLRIFEFPVRRGKLQVLRDLVQRTEAEVLVFTDANTILDSECLHKLVRHFSDPTVGAVSGEEMRVGGEGCSGESLYWRYESAIKLLESRLNCLLGANGAIYAVRRELFNPGTASLVEDLQIPLQIRFSGYRVVYDPEAIAMEDIVPSVEGQFQRRIRIAAGIYQTLFQNPGYLNPLKGAPAFAFFSHRLLRLLAPFLLLTALAANFTLAWHPLYVAILACQLLFYAMAAVGCWLRIAGKASRALALPSQFCLMNTAYIFGLTRYLMGRQALTWKVTPRQGSATEAAKS